MSEESREMRIMRMMAWERAKGELVDKLDEIRDGSGKFPE